MSIININLEDIYGMEDIQKEVISISMSPFFFVGSDYSESRELIINNKLFNQKSLIRKIERRKDGGRRIIKFLILK